MSKKKKIKTNPKIYVLSFFIVVFIGVLAVASYFTFYADADLHKMGYTYSEIKLIHQYELDEKITGYNQSLVYALNSKEFSEKNLDYYLLFDSQMDLTRVCNNLAMNYSLDEVKNFLTFLTSEQVEDLSDLKRIENIDFFQSLYEKGYDLNASLLISNQLPLSSSESFLSLGILDDYTCYINYLKTGYNDSTICAIYHQLGVENFVALSKMRKFDDATIHALVNCENFAVENLPRYLMYLDRHEKATEKAAVTAVNSNKDVIKASAVDYSSFYKDSVAAINEGDLTLVNKSHQLAYNYLPNLVKVDANYRYTDSELTQDAADAFVEMAKQCYAETERNILAYTNYVSYVTQDGNYANALIDAYNDETLIDPSIFKAGSSEHQLGLATDICEKGNSYTKFAGSKAALWLEENSYKYGYILRYKEGKEYLTGIEANDYHYRYVGIEAASTIYTYDWVLEEYYYLFVGI